MMFPPHKAALHLTHNDHKSIYQTAQEWIEDQESLFKHELWWATDTSRQRAIETDEIWELRWYPDTPIGFCVIYGATLDEVLAAALV